MGWRLVQERSWFRLEVVALAVVAAIVVYVSLNPRHKPRIDDATLPRIPTDAPPIAR